MTADSATSQSHLAAQVELESRLIREIRERLYIDVPDSETELLESGLIDSLAFVELLLIIADGFDVHVEVDDLDMQNFRSVRSIAVFIAERRPPSDRLDAR